MKLIFGLGNPEARYDATRHNLGWNIVEMLAARHGGAFTAKQRFQAEVAEIELAGHKTLLAKPSTYYNAVGESYQALCHFYRIAPADTLIIHDDLALPFGTIRSRVGGSDAGNNGIKSINLHGGKDSARLRIGTDSALRQTIGDSQFVLSPLQPSELAAWPTLSHAIENYCVAFCGQDFVPTTTTLAKE